jgi:hypothetical protein
MAEVSAKTFPIALGLGGVAIIVAAIYSYEFGQRGDLGFSVALVVVGLIVILAGIPVYYWERGEYYEDRKWPGHFVGMRCSFAQKMLYAEGL